MRFAEPPSLDSPLRGRSGDDLDGLLRGYFRAEMPEPWPNLEPPASEPVLPFAAAPRPRRWKSFRARLSLAASVALLLAGAALIGGSLRVPDRAATGPAGIGDSADTRDMPRHQPRIKREHLNVKPSGEVEMKFEFFDGGDLPPE